MAIDSSIVSNNVLYATKPKYRDLTSRLGYYLLMLIACCSPWGTVFRFEGLGERGATTFFAIGIILISLLSMKFLTAVHLHPLVLCFTGFLFIGTSISMTQDMPVLSALNIGGIRSGYWLLMVAVLSLNLDSEKGRSITRTFAISTAIMSIVSLADYFEIVQVPLFNEVYSSFELEKGKIGSLVGRSMIGPFDNRSFLGLYLSIAWPIPLMELIHGKAKNPLRIAFWSAIFVLLSFALIVCYSRALYLTVAVGGLYALYTAGYKNIFKIILIVVPLLFVLFIVAQNMFSHEMSVFLFRLESLSPDRIFRSGGQLRTSMFWTTVSDLLNNPQGMGFGLVEYNLKYLEVHSIFTEHLRPAGFLGFALVFLFMWPVLKMFKNRKAAPGILIMCSSLIGILSYGIAHSGQNMLMLWCIIGLLYSSSKKTDYSISSPDRVPTTNIRNKS